MAELNKKSKKRFYGKRALRSRLDGEFVIYLDENLHNCKPIIETLIANSIAYERHGDYFENGTLDTVWLPEVGRARVVLLSKDKKLRYNEFEKQRVNRYKVREFFFACGNINKYEMAAILAGGALNEMQRLCAKHAPPFIASITKEKHAYIRYGGEKKVEEQHEKAKVADAI